MKESAARKVDRSRESFFQSLIDRMKAKDLPLENLTLGEIVQWGEELRVKASDVVIAQSMATEGLSYREVIHGIFSAYQYNLTATEIGLIRGESFLLGKIGQELARQREKGNVLIGDRFLDKAVIYTLAAEVGNHTVGLQPCAGTGDSCVYTGLMRALMESRRPKAQIGQLAALITKVGTYFKEGKRTTGCNMEGFGAGATATAAALTELHGGSARQVGNAMVLALSPTIAVPCTPRVIVSGLCATHIGGAVLIGHLASRLAVKTNLPVDVDIDVLLAMAAKVHSTAAPIITQINLQYLRPYFRRHEGVEAYIDPAILSQESLQSEAALRQAREEIRELAKTARPLTRAFGEAVVGGSSIAVGSPTNMGRIAHGLYQGEIRKISIGLTTDLFARRAINVPGILMGAVLGASTRDIDAYRKVLKEVAEKGIEVKVYPVEEPEVQRITIEATQGDAMVDALNRGGGRIKLLDAKPSLEKAIEVAEKLGIQLAQT